jgi:hypothetical protein
MVDVKYNKEGGTPEQRVAKRLRNSRETSEADHIVQKGEGPTRTFTNIHHPAGQRQHGSKNEQPR